MSNNNSNDDDGYGFILAMFIGSLITAIIMISMVGEYYIG